MMPAMRTETGRLPIMEALEQRLLLSSGPLITELMAANENVLRDGDGVYSDWIEIYNPTGAAIDLAGWYLTDDKTDPDNRWQFPSDPGIDTSIDPNQYMLVFASDKPAEDYPYVDSAGALHTDFALSRGGEYLGLLRPDGTVAHDYDEFPAQSDDISYGLADDTVALLTARAPLRYHVPTAADAGLVPSGPDEGWTAAGFDDSAWAGLVDVPSSTIVVTEACTGSPDYVEIQNVSDRAVDTSGWIVGVNDEKNGVNAAHSVVWDLPSSMPAGQILYRTDSTSDNYWGSNIYWTNTGSGWVVILDGTGQVVDFIVWGYSTSQIASLDVSVGGHTVTAGDFWTGSSVSGASGSAAVQRTGTIDTDTAADLAFVGKTKGSQNAGLVVPFPLQSTQAVTGIGYSEQPSAFDVICYKANVTVSDLSVAESVISDPAKQSSTANELAGVVDYFGSGAGSSHFGTDNAFPGQSGGTDIDDFVIEAVGTIVIPQAGQWTFGVASDDGFSLDLTNGTDTFSISHPEVRSMADTLGTFDILTPGEYDLRLVYYEQGGSAGVELFAAQGSYATFDAGAFRLVGDTAGGGLAPAGAGGMIRTDVRAELQGVNTSLWTRITFEAGSTAFDALTLRMHYDDGFFAYLNGTLVAERNAPPLPAWDAAATAEADPEAPEEIDISAHVGLLETGTNVLAVHGLNVTASDEDCLILPELTASSSTQHHAYFDVPTPLGPNVAGAEGISGAVAFSRDGGTFSSDFSLVLTVEAPGATILYSTDGSEPDVEYGGPIVIGSTVQVRARAYEPGKIAGETTSETYVALAADMLAFTSDLPLVVLDNFGSGRPPTGSFVAGYMAVFEPGAGRTTVTGAHELDTRMGIKVRGSSTAGQAKPSYAIECWADGEDTDRNIRPFGMPAESDWILFAPFNFDRALMRDPFVYALSNAMGRYAVRTQFVEVFFNSDDDELSYDDYVGVYVFMEKIKRDDDRVDIERLTPDHNAEPEITGGYILKIDRRDPDDTGFHTSRGTPTGQTSNNYFCYVEPKESEIIPLQSAYIRQYLEDFEDALHAPDYVNPTTGLHYTEYIDVDAFIDHHWLNLLTKNPDGLRLSAFMFKDRGGKLQMGPVWDFDRTMGCDSDGRAEHPEEWNPAWDTADYFEYDWWGPLFDDPEFALRWTDRWFELRQDTFSVATMHAIVDGMAGEVAEAQVRNFAKWTQHLPNDPGGWQGEVDHLKDWLAQRVTWGDTQFPALPEFNHPGGEVPDGFELTMTAPAGEIHYTLDGGDPRQAGGTVAPEALLYVPGSPVVLHESTFVTARILNAGVWSSPTSAQFFVGTPAAAGTLAVTEINYHPHDPTAAELAVDPTLIPDTFEFIELQNIGIEPIELPGVRFTDGVSFDFSDGAIKTLDPGQFAVVVRDAAGFAVRYGAEVPVAGQYALGLDRGGEQITLTDAFGGTIVSFTYNGDGNWPDRPEGKGSTLEITDPAADPDNDDNWRGSSEFGGTPGAAGAGPVVDVVVNEVLANCQGPDVDAIELVNTTGGDIDVGGWFLSDSSADYTAFQIPADTVIQGGKYKVFTCGADFAFGLDAEGDDVWLLEADATGKLTRFADHLKFGATPPGVSIGRWPDGTGEPAPLAAVTLGAENAPPRTGEIVINEIHSNPDVKTEPVEFIELHNTGAEDVDISGWYFSDGISYTFPADTVVPHGGYVVVAEDPAAVLAKYGAEALGPFAGKIENEGERIVLRDEAGIVQDQVDYGLGFPWPTVGDAPGYSIELINPALDNDLGGSWRASTGTPITQQVIFDAEAEWLIFEGTAEPSAVPGQWRTVGFDDSAWTAGNAAIGYGEAFITTPLAMEGNYTTFYLRKEFTLTPADIAGISRLLLDAQYDDGFNAWINGSFVQGANVDSQEIPYDGVAGESIENANFVPFDLLNPGSYLRAAPETNVMAVQVLNHHISSSSDAFWDARLLTGTGGDPGVTPGAVNSVYAAAAPPQMRQVSHTPGQPVSGQDVTVTAKVTDPDGVASVGLEYQLVEPGDYIAINDPRYATQWTAVAMVDDGTGGDALAGDDVYTVVLPGAIQTHRRLVRYRITAEDALGAAVTGPYADDPQPNFAYFVYDGVPAWTGAAQPGVTEPVTYSSDLLTSVPVYHLITTETAHEDSQHIPDSTTGGYAGSEYKWPGTLVYDGCVYDHIRYRARGGVWRYAMGKNMWKFDFNRGHYFQAADNYGNPYDVTWDKLNFSAIIQQGDYWHRGEQGLFESVGFDLFNKVGAEAPTTSYLHFRIIDGASEAGPTQYDGDFEGLYMTVEQMDGRFLDEHDLPDGNLYKMEGGTGTLNNQGPDHPTDRSDLDAFKSTYESNPNEQWWRDNLNLDDYYGYRAIVEGIHHYDILAGKNYFYYNNPETNRWEVLPWDLDLTWANNMYGNGNEPFKSRVLAIDTLAQEYRNRMREIRDLLYNPEQTGMLIDEYASVVYTPGAPSLVDADRAMWDYSPIMTSGLVNSSKAGAGKFYESSPTGDFPGMMQLMKDYVVSRGAWIDSTILTDSAAIPDTPVLTYIGEPTFPLDNLPFQTSAFAGPGGANFAAMTWRIAAVTNPGSPDFDPAEPRLYEIDADWESDEITVFSDTAVIPGGGLTVGQTYRVRVRMKDDAGRWSHWSDPVEFVAGDATGPVVDGLRVTEVNYAPHDPTPAELASQPPGDDPYTPGDFEFVEFTNVADEPIDLTGVWFTNGVVFDFTGGAVTSLGPGQYVAVVASPSSFEARYGTGLTVAGQFTGSLNNGGEQIKLKDAYGRVIQDFEYGSLGDWPGAAAGKGAALEVLDANADYEDPGNWRSSVAYGGTPAAAGLDEIGVVVNEVLAHTDMPLVDGIELHNTTAADIDIAGWYLSDSWGWASDPANGDYMKFQIPVLDLGQPGKTLLPAGGYVAFHEGHYEGHTLVHDPLTEFGGTGAGDFALDSAEGDDVWLMATDASGELAAFADHVAFGASANAESHGRWPDGSGPLYPMAERTLGSANTGPRVGPTIVSEVMYNPPDTDGDGTGIDPGDIEFIEIHNASDSAVDLWRTYFVDGAWQDYSWTVEGFAFAAGTTLGPGGTLVVVGFDPAAEPAKLADFEAHYGIAGRGVPIFGPFNGALSNGGETVRLVWPDEPPAENTSITPYILADEVIYSDVPPWPESPDGAGDSLHRAAPDAWGNDPASWTADLPTPGAHADTTGPTLDAWYSAAVHDGTELLLEIADDGSFSEPRQGGITTLVLAFSEPVNLSGASVALAGSNPDPMDLSGITATVTNRAPDVGEIAFSEALPDVARYRVRLDGVADIAGNALAGDSDRAMTALVGDADGSLDVDMLDLLHAWDRRGQAAGAGADRTRCDIDLSGEVGVLDAMSAWDHRGDDTSGFGDPVPQAQTPGQQSLDEMSQAYRSRGASESVLESPRSSESPGLGSSVTARSMQAREYQSLGAQALGARSSDDMSRGLGSPRLRTGPTPRSGSSQLEPDLSAGLTDPLTDENL